MAESPSRAVGRPPPSTGMLNTAARKLGVEPRGAGGQIFARPLERGAPPPRRVAGLLVVVGGSPCRSSCSRSVIWSGAISSPPSPFCYRLHRHRARVEPAMYSGTGTARRWLTIASSSGEPPPAARGPHIGTVPSIALPPRCLLPGEPGLTEMVRLCASLADGQPSPAP